VPSSFPSDAYGIIDTLNQPNPKVTGYQRRFHQRVNTQELQPANHQVDHQGVDTHAATWLTLDNGLTLVHQEIVSAVVAVDVWVKVGAAHDPLESLGMAHFLEHMIFKGTENIAPGEFDQIIEYQGGMSNACTSLDYTHFHCTTAAPRFTDTLPILAEMLLSAKIDPIELASEREVVLEELRQALDDPDYCAVQNLSATMYGDHPYGRAILGQETTVTSITPDQMRDFHRQYYRPENMTVVVVGAVSQAQAIAIVNEAFNNGAFNNGVFNSVANQEPAFCELPTVTVKPQRYVTNLPQIEQGRFLMAWSGPGATASREAVALDVIAAILSTGRTSRLVRQLREEKGWVQDIDASFCLQEVGGMFMICAYLDHDHVEPVEHLVNEVLRDIAAGQINSSELARAQRNLCNGFTFGMESPRQVANFLGYHGVIGCEGLYDAGNDTYCQVARSLTVEELAAVAQTYLTPENAVVAAYLPE
jgi:predicted Zn-dependent peptidase